MPSWQLCEQSYIAISFSCQLPQSSSACSSVQFQVISVEFTCTFVVTEYLSNDK